MKTLIMLAGLTVFLIPTTGCVTFLPTDFLSGFALNPAATCDELTVQLHLGTLPSVSSPADVGLQSESLFIQSRNGRQLHAWFVPAQSDGELDAAAKGTVLILHGTDGTLTCALPWVLVAACNHMHAVVFDYQGYGQSEGTPDIATLLDDGEAVLAWIVSDDAAARQKVHLLGTSLGTGPALGLAALRPRPQLQSVVLDGAWDPEETVSAVEAEVCSLFPLFGLSTRLGFLWLFETRDALGGMTLPALFIHAENDLRTPLSGANTMYELVGSLAKSFWLFEDMTHIQPLFLAEDAYVSLVVTLWRSPAGAPSPAAAETDPTICVPALSP